MNCNDTDVGQEYGDDDFSASIDVSSAETAEIAMDTTKDTTCVCATTDVPTTDVPPLDVVVATQHTSKVIILCILLLYFTYSIIFIVIFSIIFVFNTIIYVQQLEHTLMSIAQEGFMRMRGVTSCFCQHARGQTIYSYILIQIHTYSYILIHSHTCALYALIFIHR